MSTSIYVMYFGLMFRMPIGCGLWDSRGTWDAGNKNSLKICGTKVRIELTNHWSSGEGSTLSYQH